MPRGIMKAHVLESDRAARRLGQRPRVARRRDLGDAAQKVEQPLRRAGGPLQFTHDLAQGRGRRGDDDGIEDEG